MSMMSSGSQFFNRSATNTGFADPFNDIATTQMPTTMKSALWRELTAWQWNALSAISSQTLK